jgi:hypothetical protein
MKVQWSSDNATWSPAFGESMDCTSPNNVDTGLTSGTVYIRIAQQCVSPLEQSAWTASQSYTFPTTTTTSTTSTTTTTTSTTTTTTTSSCQTPVLDAINLVSGTTFELQWSNAGNCSTITAPAGILVYYSNDSSFATQYQTSILPESCTSPGNFSDGFYGSGTIYVRIRYYCENILDFSAYSNTLSYTY